MCRASGSLLRNCHSLEDHFRLDEPDVYFFYVSMFDVSMFGEGQSESFVDCPGLQARPWSCMKTLKVAFTRVSRSVPYLMSFTLNFDESCPRARTIVDVQDQLPIS